MTNAMDLMLQQVFSEDLAEVELMENTEFGMPSAVNAMSSVLNYIITDAFDLDPTESFWIGYELGTILAPLEKLLPLAVLGAVKKEMDTQEYSRRMMTRATNFHGARNDFQPEVSVSIAPISDWVDSLSDIVLTSYPSLRPMLRSSIIGSIHGLLTELGVTSDPKNTRRSLYLPNAVRYLVKR